MARLLAEGSPRRRVPDPGARSFPQTSGLCHPKGLATIQDTESSPMTTKIPFAEDTHWARNLKLAPASKSIAWPAKGRRSWTCLRSSTVWSLSGLHALGSSQDHFLHECRVAGRDDNLQLTNHGWRQSNARAGRPAPRYSQIL